MSIYFNPIQGPDAGVTQRGYGMLADRIAAAREAQRQREQAAANMLLQRDQLKAEQQRWGAQNAIALGNQGLDREKLNVDQAREKRQTDVDARNAEIARIEREKNETERIAGIKERVIKLASTGDPNDAQAARVLAATIGGKPTDTGGAPVDATSQPSPRVQSGAYFQNDPYAVSANLTPPAQPGALPAPASAAAASGGTTFDFGGEHVTVDPEASRAHAQQIEAQKRNELVARTLEQYKGMDSGDKRIAGALDLFRRDVQTGAIPVEKAASELHDTIRAIHAEDAGIKRAHITAPRLPTAPAVVINDVANLNNNIRAMDDLKSTIQNSPEAWTRWTGGMESWQRKEIGNSGGVVDQIIGAPRRIAQVVGLADISPEQQFKGDPEALKIHRGVNRMLTAIAKGYGGVITQSDINRALSEIGALGMDPDQALEYVRQKFDDLKSQRAMFEDNTRGQYSDPTTGATPTQRSRIDTARAASPDRSRPGRARKTTLADEVDSL